MKLLNTLLILVATAMPAACSQAPAASPPMDADQVASTGSVQGHITNGGQPLSGAALTIATAADGRVVATATTDDSGAYAVVLEPGAYFLSVNGGGNNGGRYFEIAAGGVVTVNFDTNSTPPPITIGVGN